MKERILITGGAGFIGTHLVDRLVQSPGSDQVTIDIVDDLSSSKLTPERHAFFRRHGILFHHKTVEEFECSPDVTYSQIYHLACRVGPAHVTKFSGRMGLEIVADAVKMADLAIRDRAPLISISTSEVYGRDPEGKPQHESLALEVPADTSARIEYTLGKMMTEKCLLNLADVNPGLTVNLIRPFNIVGPYQTAEGGYVLPRFVEAAIENQPLTVFGDGTQIRAFTHVFDLVESLIRIVNSGTGKIYNVGTPENTIQIGELAMRVVDLLGSHSTITHIDPQKVFGDRYTNAPSKIPDITLIERELGWRPKWMLDDIIKHYASFVRNDETIAATAA